MDGGAEDMRERLGGALEAAGLALPSADVDALARHLELVYEANRTLNLTRVPPCDAPVVHVVDSLRGLEAMATAGEGTWADLGAGAGFPGVPLAVAAKRRVDLLESIRKKARFLEAVAADLCLDITVRPIRAEDAARDTPEAYSAVAARAVGSLPELVELGSPLLRPGGVLVAWKAAVSDEEIARGDRAGRICGLTRSEETRYSLPGQDAARVLVVYEKTRAPQVALPRQVGLAKRRPLA